MIARSAVTLLGRGGRPGAVPGSSHAAGDTIVVTTTIQAAVDAADPATRLVPDGIYRSPSP